MAVKIKLKRLGKIRTPQYRIIVADSRTKRDGRAIEELGLYHPKEDPSLIRLDSDRVQYWLGVGAQPTEPVLAILKITGDWQRFRGEPGAEGTLREPEARTDRSEVFQRILAEHHDRPAPTEKASGRSTPTAAAAAPDAPSADASDSSPAASTEA